MSTTPRLIWSRSYWHSIFLQRQINCHHNVPTRNQQGHYHLQFLLHGKMCIECQTMEIGKSMKKAIMAEYAEPTSSIALLIPTAIDAASRLEIAKWKRRSLFHFVGLRWTRTSFIGHWKYSPKKRLQIAKLSRASFFLKLNMIIIYYFTSLGFIVLFYCNLYFYYSMNSTIYVTIRI